MNRVLILILLFFVTLPCYGAGVTLWLPVNQSPLLENDLEKLASLASITQLKRPYSLNLVQQKLEQISDSHPALYRRLRKALRQYENTGSVSHARLSLSHHGDNSHLIENMRGLRTDSSAHLSLTAVWKPSSWYAISGGIDASEDDFNPSGTIISVGTDWAQIDLGYKDHWWSPFQGGARMISTHSATMPSISIENSVPLELFGVGLNYELFIAQMSSQPTLYRGEFSDTNKPLLSGVHIGLQPVQWWNIGFNRVFQFAGGERPEDFETLVRAFIDPRGADNDANVDDESGNQLASIVSKMHFDDFTFSAELAGEDTSNNKDWQLGNTAVTFGIFIPFFFSEAVSLTYEYSDWQDGWYTNNVYQKGYSNEESIVGDWAMQDQFRAGTSVEGSSHFLKLVHQHDNGHAQSYTVRAYEYAESPADFQTGWAAELEYSYPIKHGSIFTRVYGGEDAFGENFFQVRVGWQWK